MKKMLLVTLLIIISANCYAESSGAQTHNFVEEFVGVDASGCNCGFYIPVGRGHGFKPILFSSCDQNFTLMKLNGRLNLFEKTDPSLNIENEVEITLRNPFYKLALNLKKTGAGEESVWYEGELIVKDNWKQQTIKIIGACGL